MPLTFLGGQAGNFLESRTQEQLVGALWRSAQHRGKVKALTTVCLGREAVRPTDLTQCRVPAQGRMTQCSGPTVEDAPAVGWAVPAPTLRREGPQVFLGGFGKRWQGLE